MPQELPKLSGITARLKAPETQFEGMVAKATGFTPPPGPQSLLLRLQEAFEAGKTPELPKAEELKLPALETLLERLPALPTLAEEKAPAKGEKAPAEMAKVY